MCSFLLVCPRFSPLPYVWLHFSSFVPGSLRFRMCVLVSFRLFSVLFISICLSSFLSVSFWFSPCLAWFLYVSLRCSLFPYACLGFSPCVLVSFFVLYVCRGFSPFLVGSCRFRMLVLDSFRFSLILSVSQCLYPFLTVCPWFSLLCLLCNAISHYVDLCYDMSCLEHMWLYVCMYI